MVLTRVCIPKQDIVYIDVFKNHLNLIVQFFCNLLFSFNNMFLRFTFVNVCGCEPFLFTVQIYHYVLIQSAIDCHLGCVEFCIFLSMRMML